MEKKSLIEKFKDEIELADWSMLKAHQERDAIWLIEADLDIFEVANAIANDDVVVVKAWKESSLIRKLSSSEIDLWESSQHEKIVKFLIVSPFVLIQKVSDD